MGGPRATPILVGIGDIKNPSLKVEDALEPMQLMLRAIQNAIKDTKLSPSAAKELHSDIDSIDVVASWTWPYPDLPGLLSKHLGLKPKHLFYPTFHGGNQPGQLFDEAARRISYGQSKVAVVTGGEALASLAACAAAQKLPPPGWAKIDEKIESIFARLARERKGGMANIHYTGNPTHVYPLFENGFRVHRGQSIQENDDESAQLYAEFAKVAQQNPMAWNYGKPAETAESIKTVSRKNRMICFPYPLLMNAFNNVNMAGACILTSTEYARKIGIPESQWIYPLGGAGTCDSSDFWDRPNFYTSPSISRSLDAGIEISGLQPDQIDLFDFYSCFPIVPKIACHHLGLPKTNPPKPITLLGGLTSFGGAGNNYSMHGIIEVARELRNGNGQHGLVLANGGVMSYQHVVCISRNPRADDSPYPSANPLPQYVTDIAVPLVDREPEGEAVIETYTAEFNRDGSPFMGHVVGRLKESGHRFIANHGDESTLQQLVSTSKEVIGRTGWVRKDAETKGRNLFSFEAGGKL